MADYRPIKIKIWDDDWFISLNPDEKAVWFFLLTNKNTHISGIYELPKPLIRVYVGGCDIEKILSKFEKDGKIVYKSGWIFLRNYLKHQTKQINKQDNIIKSIIGYLKDNSEIIELFNLKNETSYKPLISPFVDPPIKIKDKRLKIKDILPTKVGEKVIPTYEQIKTNKTRHIHIIGLFWEYTCKEFENYEQYQAQLQRHLRASKMLIGYSDEQIIGAMEKCEANSQGGKKYNWTLDTVLKNL